MLPGRRGVTAWPGQNAVKIAELTFLEGRRLIAHAVRGRVAEGIGGAQLLSGRLAIFRVCLRQR